MPYGPNPGTVWVPSGIWSSAGDTLMASLDGLGQTSAFGVSNEGVLKTFGLTAAGTITDISFDIQCSGGGTGNATIQYTTDGVTPLGAATVLNPTAGVSLKTITFSGLSIPAATINAANFGIYILPTANNVFFDQILVTVTTVPPSGAGAPPMGDDFATYGPFSGQVLS